jgi:hypothetical protein
MVGEGLIRPRVSAINAIYIYTLGIKLSRIQKLSEVSK